MFEHIERAHVTNALKRVSEVSRGLQPELKQRLVFLNDLFHADKRWELVCTRWEHMLAESQEDETSFHDAVMSLMSLMFSIGFDEGFKHLLERSAQEAPTDTN